MTDIEAKRRTSGVGIYNTVASVLPWTRCKLTSVRWRTDGFFNAD